MRENNPVAERNRLSPRTVPLHKRWVDRLAEMVIEQLDRVLSALPPDVPLEDKRTLVRRSVTLAGLETVQGTPVGPIGLRVITNAALKNLAYVEGSLTQKIHPYRPAITVFVAAGELPGEVLSFFAGEGMSLIRTVLAHELTHLVDYVPGRNQASGSTVGSGEEGFRRYVNHPGEIAAFAQQISAEALESARFFPRVQSRQTASAAQYVEQTLATSSTYQKIASALTPESHRTLRRLLAAGMQRQGLLDAFEEPLPPPRQKNPLAPEDRLSPRTVPLDRSWVSTLFDAAVALVREVADTEGGDRPFSTSWEAVVLVPVAGLETVAGTPIGPVRLTVQGRPPPLMDAASRYRGPADAHPEIVLRFPAGHTMDETAHLIETSWAAHTRSILAHELTHLVDRFPERAPRPYLRPGPSEAEMVRYANQPSEERAFAQQVASEALAWARADGPWPGRIRARRSHISAADYVEAALLQSPTFRALRPLLRDKTVRSFRRTIAAALTRAGALNAFEDVSFDLPRRPLGSALRSTP